VGTAPVCEGNARAMIGIQRKKFFGILLGHLPKTPITYSRASCKVGPKHELYLG